MALPSDIGGRIAALGEPDMSVSPPRLPISPLRGGAAMRAFSGMDLLRWCDKMEAEAARVISLN